MINTPSKGKIYLSSPIASYDTPLYDANLDLIKKRWPTAEIVPARGRYRNNEDWLEKWEAEYRTYTGAVFFDYDGFVGKGVYKEINDLDLYSTPVLYLTGAGDFIPLYRLNLVIYQAGIYYSRYAKIIVKGR